MLTTDQPGSPPAAPDHPLRFVMGIAAFLSYNLTFGAMWGCYGIVLTAIEKQYGVGRETSSLVAPAVMVVVALFAPVVGNLVDRVSLRLLMIAGACLSLSGYLVIAFAPNFWIMLAAYAVLIGPGMCISGAVVPSALITRWFSTNRGKALGIVHMPILFAGVPLIATTALKAGGLQAAYLAMAALIGVALIAQFFVRDRPPGYVAPVANPSVATASAGGLSTWELLAKPRFWFVTLAYSANIAGTIMLSSHIVPMTAAWGISATQAAIVLTMLSAPGIVGPPLLGWMADRFGGMVALGVLCFDSCVLWALFLTQPGFLPTAVIVGLIGLHSAGAVPAFGVTISQSFGQESFGRAFGLGMMLTLPFTVAAVPLAGALFKSTGSYATPILIQTIFFGLAALLIATVARQRPAPVATIPA